MKKSRFFRALENIKFKFSENLQNGLIRVVLSALEMLSSEFEVRVPEVQVLHCTTGCQHVNSQHLFDAQPPYSIKQVMFSHKHESLIATSAGCATVWRVFRMFWTNRLFLLRFLKCQIHSEWMNIVLKYRVEREGGGGGGGGEGMRERM